MVLTGAVEEKHVSIPGQFLADLPKAITPNRNIGNINPPKENRVVKRAEEIGETMEQVEITFIYANESVSFEETETSRLLDKLLHDMLYGRLRIEHSLCYGVGVRTIRDNTYSQLWINVKTDEKNIELIEREFNNILIEIKDGKRRDKFAVAKDTYFEQVRSSESLSDQIADNALREISRFDGKFVSLQDQLAMIEKVAYEDITRYIEQRLKEEYRYTEIILPSS